MSDERFARQYRFGPPPGFLLASTCTSIVHHLSGPSANILARYFTEDPTPPVIQFSRTSHIFGFPASLSLTLKNSQLHWTPWPVFQDGWSQTTKLRRSSLRKQSCLSTATSGNTRALQWCHQTSATKETCSWEHNVFLILVYDAQKTIHEKRTPHVPDKLLCLAHDHDSELETRCLRSTTENWSDCREPCSKK